MFELLLNIILSFVIFSGSNFNNEVEKYIYTHFNQYDSLSYTIHEDINRFINPEINSSRKPSVIGDKFFIPISYYDQYRNRKEKFLTVSIKLYKKVWVTQSIVEKGTVIDETNTIKLLHDLTSIKGTPFLNEKVLGKIITKINLQPGTVVCNEYLNTKPVLEPGDQINLVYQYESIAVSMIGTVRQAGAVGDIIKVKTDKRQYSAKIINNHEAIIVE